MRDKDLKKTAQKLCVSEPSLVSERSVVSPCRHQPQRPLGAVRSGQTVPCSRLRSQPVFLLLRQPPLISPHVQHRVCALSALFHQSDITSQFAVIHPVPPLHGEPDGTPWAKWPGRCAAWPAFFQQLQPKHPCLQTSHPRGLSWDRGRSERCH